MLIPTNVSGFVFRLFCRRYFSSSMNSPGRQNVRMSTIRLNPVWHRMLYSCTHMATVGVKGLIPGLACASVSCRLYYCCHLLVTTGRCHVCVSSCCDDEGLGSDDEVRLVDHLFEGYNPLIRPVRNLTDVINVGFNLALIQLINVVSILSSLISIISPATFCFVCCLSL